MGNKQSQPGTQEQPPSIVNTVLPTTTDIDTKELGKYAYKIEELDVTGDDIPDGKLIKQYEYKNGKFEKIAQKYVSFTKINKVIKDKLEELKPKEEPKQEEPKQEEPKQEEPQVAGRNKRYHKGGEDIEINGKIYREIPRDYKNENPQFQNNARILEDKPLNINNANTTTFGASFKQAAGSTLGVQAGMLPLLILGSIFGSSEGGGRKKRNYNRKQKPKRK